MTQALTWNSKPISLCVNVQNMLQSIQTRGKQQEIHGNQIQFRVDLHAWENDSTCHGLVESMFWDPLDKMENVRPLPAM